MCLAVRLSASPAAIRIPSAAVPSTAAVQKLQVWVNGVFTAFASCTEPPASSLTARAPPITTTKGSLNSTEELSSLASMKSTLSLSAKHKAARSANLQRRRKLGIELGNVGLGPDSIRALVVEAVCNAYRQRGQRGTTRNVVLTFSYATGASRSRLERTGSTNLAPNIFQGAENVVLGEVDIITAGGHVERHRHEHIHVHIHLSRVVRRTRGFGDSAVDPSLAPPNKGDTADRSRGTEGVFFFSHNAGLISQRWGS
ncbi:hypothetical protein DFP72DRAFT_1124192 [Ephemerocybe angulata]|uniref:Uncharacterized protein n=1 Tax=Ephemerocybe angulata TaxID=980116 RepID=A0A8H6M807_9AGAR|nr:hypothetical protein DFP72DRAFT_1124192 [Tulosesus angulatus]